MIHVWRNLQFKDQKTRRSLRRSRNKKNAMPDDPAEAKYPFSSQPQKTAKLGPNPAKIFFGPSKNLDKFLGKNSGKKMSKKILKFLRKKTDSEIG